MSHCDISTVRELFKQDTFSSAKRYMYRFYQQYMKKDNFKIIYVIVLYQQTKIFMIKILALLMIPTILDDP